jgi:hypothetical protein
MVQHPEFAHSLAASAPTRSSAGPLRAARCVTGSTPAKAAADAPPHRTPPIFLCARPSCSSGDAPRSVPPEPLLNAS